MISVSKGYGGYTSIMKRVLSIFLALTLLLCAFPLQPRAAAASGKKLIALTFDDGPGAYTNRLLDELKKRNVKVTFFMVGSCVRQYPETAKRAYREGHQVANHSYDHPDLTTLSSDGVKSQIKRTSELLDKACGVGTSYLVRPPYGSTNSQVRSAIGAPLIIWSVDPADWKYRNAETVRKNIVSNAHDGAIVLAHDIHATTVDGVIVAIDELLADGYEFVTVRELFRRRGEALENGLRYYSCGPNGTDLGPVNRPEITVGTSGSQVTLTMNAQKGAQVYYTLDGSDINQESACYTAPITVKLPITLRAVAAYDLNGSRSEEITQKITIPPAAAPELTVKGGKLSASCETQGAKIHYTLDGSVPTVSSPIYSGPFTVTPGTVVTAYAEGKDLLDSDTVWLTYSALGNVFRDVLPRHWYYDSIDRAAALEIMAGMGGGYFAPEGKVTRGQLAALLYRYAGRPTVKMSQPKFSDVNPDAYYAAAIAWAQENGIVSGYGNGTFRPDCSITRQEMCQLLSAFLIWRGVELEAGSGASDKYADSSMISSWAKPAVDRMTAAGLIYGDNTGSFIPQGTATRAQSAALLIRILDLENGVRHN